MVPVPENDDSTFIIFVKVLIGVGTAIMILVATISRAIFVINLKRKAMGFVNSRKE
jgi:flagellar biosynthesis protein FliP